MSAAVIDLEVDDFAYAARLLVAQADHPLGSALRSTWTVLADGRGMAGSDPGGAAWAAQYDRAAMGAVNSAVAAVQSVEHLARLFAQTARNYLAADTASTPATDRRLAAEVAALPATTTFWLPSCAPPPAAGGSGGGPPGWSLIEDAVGYVWPNGHQDRLRRTAGAWRRSASALRAAAGPVRDAPRSAALHQLPEHPDMLAVCAGLAAHLEELAEALDGLGGACDDLAHHLDTVHSEVIGELKSLVEWTAGIEAGGAVLSVVTFGAAEVGAQAVEAARIARTATLVGGCIERFLESVRLLTATVGGLADRVAVAGARFRSLLEVPLVEPVVAGVGPLRVLNEAKEVQAAGRLAGEAAPGVRIFADRVAARAGLPGRLGTASNRFFRGATSKCRDFRITALANGHHRMEFFAPARNAGYGKRYVQIVDSDGAVVAEYKDTMGPGGLIERKWVHGEPR